MRRMPNKCIDRDNEKAPIRRLFIAGHAYVRRAGEEKIEKHLMDCRYACHKHMIVAAVSGCDIL